MAQSKSFFGLRKGSTKSLTFQVLNGKQITKDRVYNVKNPQTLAQMQQRALMATAVTAYSNLKTICDHSFEGFEVGAKTMAEFIKNNIVMLSKSLPNINITEYKTGVYANNKYLVSKGTLPQPSTKIENKKFIVNTGYTNDTGAKWGDIAEKMGIKKGGMLTLMLVSSGQTDWLRIKFNEEIWNMDVSVGNGFIAELAEKNAIEGNALEFETIVSMENPNTSPWKLNMNVEDGELAAAIISEKSEGKWKRSTAYLDGKLEYFYEAGFATYPINTTLLLNGGKMSTNVITK